MTQRNAPIEGKLGRIQPLNSKFESNRLKIKYVLALHAGAGMCCLCLGRVHRGHSEYGAGIILIEKLRTKDTSP